MVYVISGISGSGKSSLVAPLKAILGNDWDVWDIDPMVENMPDFGHPELPRLSSWNPGDGKSDYNACKNALVLDAIGNTEKTVLCGTLLPSEVNCHVSNMCELRWIGLYANSSAIAARLLARGWNKEKVDFFKNSFDWFKDIPKQVPGGMPLIDTSHKDPALVAQQVSKHIIDGMQ